MSTQILIVWSVAGLLSFVSSCLAFMREYFIKSTSLDDEDLPLTAFDSINEKEVASHMTLKDFSR